MSVPELITISLLFKIYELALNLNSLNLSCTKRFSEICFHSSTHTYAPLGLPFSIAFLLHVTSIISSPSVTLSLILRLSSHSYIHYITFSLSSLNFRCLFSSSSLIQPSPSPSSSSTRSIACCQLSLLSLHFLHFFHSCSHLSCFLHIT